MAKNQSLRGLEQGEVIKLDTLYKKAWKWFSRAIRMQEKYICITCGRKIEASETEAGHFKHGGNNKFSFWADFTRENIHCQCNWCNHKLHGNLGIYAEKLVKMYGENILERLNGLNKKSDEWGIADLEMIIEESKKISAFCEENC